MGGGAERGLAGGAGGPQTGSRVRVARQGRLQSQDLGKHLAGVEDLLQLHELVEADIAVQAERVRAVSASALRFCDPGKGESGRKREGVGRRTRRAGTLRARLGKPRDRKGDERVVGDRLGREP